MPYHDEDAYEKVTQNANIGGGVNPNPAFVSFKNSHSALLFQKPSNICFESGCQQSTEDHHQDLTLAQQDTQVDDSYNQNQGQSIEYAHPRQPTMIVNDYEENNFNVR